MTTAISESEVEAATLAWLESLGWTVLHGPQIAVGEPGAERSDPYYQDVVLEHRLRDALARLNPTRRQTHWRMLFASSRVPKGLRWRHAIAPSTVCSWME